VEDILQDLSCVNKGNHLDLRETSGRERKIGARLNLSAKGNFAQHNN
jgi:hypothetical protein